jgi:murein DD-endopeptidase MepM/ murein hydrolase activator NlpD
MTEANRGRTRALWALLLAVGLLAPLPARAQVVHEQVGGSQVRGAYLVHPVTPSDPDDGGRVVVDDVDAFDPDGGIAIFEPASPRREVFDYAGIDTTTSQLTDVVRTAPGSHPGGSFVRAVPTATPSPSPSESPSSPPKPRAKPSSRPSTSPSTDPSSGPTDLARDDAARPAAGFGAAEEQAPQPRTFSTAKLVSAAAQLGGLGWSERWARVVYRPFPVAGPATFSDTWGALRYGPAPGQVRGHEGQDIFCDFGAPVLAVTAGRIQYDANGLGGRIARLRMRDGSYWYYAHLSRWNKKEVHSGDRVEPGDVIGYCGHSGNAKTTPDHLHFGWYSKKEEARNPMAVLVGWLRTAQADAGALVEKVERRVARRMELEMLGRMFGDSWAPDLTAAMPSPLPSAITDPAASPSAACDPGAIAPVEPRDAAPCVPTNEALVPTTPEGTT